MSEQQSFYPESRKPDPPPRPQGFLPDESAETGNPGDLGGGYNDLNAGRLKPKPKNPHWPTDESKTIGKIGLQNARKALEEANQPKPTDDLSS